MFFDTGAECQTRFEPTQMVPFTGTYGLQVTTNPVRHIFHPIVLNSSTFAGSSIVLPWRYTNSMLPKVTFHLSVCAKGVITVAVEANICISSAVMATSFAKTNPVHLLGTFGGNRA